MVYISNHDDPSTMIHDALTFNHQIKSYNPKEKENLHKTDNCINVQCYWALNTLSCIPVFQREGHRFYLILGYDVLATLLICKK